MSDERAAVRTIFRGQEFVDASDYDALRAENTELSARVSKLTRLLAEAEGAIQAYFEGEHHPLIEGVNRLIEDANSYSDATIEWKVRAINAERDLEEAEEALREALSPPARRASEDERIVALEEEVAQWKIASGLERNGCPEDVRPEDIARRLRSLESLVRAADRMRELVNDILPMYIGDDYEEILETRDAYDTQRAAVGEIGEE